MECNFENCPNFERLGKKFADRILELERENAELKAYKDVNEDFKTAWEELKAENELIKTQYNCYACGNCKGKEDYINLEKHHKGLRKQFDKKVQTLQEIKEIAEDAYENESEYQATGVYNEIIQKITKAESEG